MSTPTMADELPELVLRILDGHRGAQDAITGKCIAGLLGYKDDRTVRIAIAQLIADGHPIAASTGSCVETAPDQKLPPGYFVVETEGEAVAYERALRSRAVLTFERLRDFQRAVTRAIGVPFQPVLLRVGETGADAAQAVRDADANEMW